MQEGAAPFGNTRSKPHLPLHHPADGPPSRSGEELKIPLARWADDRLRELAKATGSAAIAALSGASLLGMRGSANGYTINGRVSAGIGGSRLMPTRDGGWFALTLLRTEDRTLLPALFGDAALACGDDDAIAGAVLAHDCADLVARGRLLGLPVASADEVPASPPVAVIARGPRRSRAAGHRPLVVDLSAIWAGPLAGHLLWLAGAEVVKVESAGRPDLIRRDDAATFDRLNQGKASALVDLANDAGRRALMTLMERADIVIESSRPRALRPLGIDADALVEACPGLVWLTVTGHGATGEAAGWAGVGNDCGVAAGLSRAMADAGGTIGYVGDAITDPLTGIVGALAAWRAYQTGEACRIGLAMSAIGAQALAEERMRDSGALAAELRAWSAAVGRPFPRTPLPPLTAPVSPLGAQTARYLPC